MHLAILADPAALAVIDHGSVVVDARRATLEHRAHQHDTEL